MNVTAPKAGVLAKGFCESIRSVHFGQTLPALGSNDAQRIRQYWHLEKRLHWVKDVVLQED